MSEGQRATSVEDEPLFPQLPGSEWRDLANCLDEDNALFFPAQARASQEMVEKALGICAACEVKEECLDYALEFNQHDGIWGGLDEEDRRRLRKRWLADKRRNHIRE